MAWACVWGGESDSRGWRACVTLCCVAGLVRGEGAWSLRIRAHRLNLSFSHVPARPQGFPPLPSFPPSPLFCAGSAPLCDTLCSDISCPCSPLPLPPRHKFFFVFFMSQHTHPPPLPPPPHPLSYFSGPSRLPIFAISSRRRVARTPNLSRLPKGRTAPNSRSAAAVTCTPSTSRTPRKRRSCRSRCPLA